MFSFGFVVGIWMVWVAGNPVVVVNLLRSYGLTTTSVSTTTSTTTTTTTTTTRAVTLYIPGNYLSACSATCSYVTTTPSALLALSLIHI